MMEDKYEEQVMPPGIGKTKEEEKLVDRIEFLFAWTN